MADLRRRANNRASAPALTFLSDLPPDEQRAAVSMLDFVLAGVRDFSIANAPAADALRRAGLATFRPGGPGRIHVRPRSRLTPRKGAEA
jgi:hypothetical protein